MKILISTSATSRQQSNAKAVFGSKSVSILKALEEASKEKALATPGLDALLSDLKLSEADFAKVSGKAAFTKAVAAAKSFVSAKTFAAKLSALKSIKYTSAKVTSPKAASPAPSASPSPSGKLNFLRDEDLSIVMGYEAFYYYQDNGKVCVIIAEDSGSVDNPSDVAEIPFSAIANKAAFQRIVESLSYEFMDKGDVSAYCKRKGFVLRPETKKDSSKSRAFYDKMEKEFNSFRKDITPILKHQNLGGDGESKEAHAAFSKIFGFSPAANVEVGYGDNSDDEGIYFKTGKSNVVCIPHPSSVREGVKLGTTYASFLVYVDSYKNEGPFLGEPRPVKGTVTGVNTWTEAKQAFIDLCKKENSGLASVSSGSSKKEIDAFYSEVDGIIKAVESNGDDTSKEAHAAFSKVFGFSPAKGIALGLGDDGDEEGLYFSNRKNTAACIPDPGSIARTLKLGNKKVPFLVYLDSNKDEGPFLGKPDAVKGTIVTANTWAEAKQAFADLCKKVNSGQKR